MAAEDKFFEFLNMLQPQKVFKNLILYTVVPLPNEELKSYFNPFSEKFTKKVQFFKTITDIYPQGIFEVYEEATMLDNLYKQVDDLESKILDTIFANPDFNAIFRKLSKLERNEIFRNTFHIFAFDLLEKVDKERNIKKRFEILKKEFNKYFSNLGLEFPQIELNIAYNHLFQRLNDLTGRYRIMEEILISVEQKLKDLLKEANKQTSFDFEKEGEEGWL